MNDTPTTDMNQTDQILEGLRPRMHAARIAHFRRLAAGVAVVPLLGFGAAAMAAGGDTTDIETAVAPVEEVEEIDVPEIDEPDVVVVPDEPKGDEGETAEEAEPVETTTTTTAAPDPDAPKDIDLGALGWVEVTHTDDAFDVLAYDLAEGWAVVGAETVEGTLQILLTNGDSTKVVVIKPGPRDEILVIVEEFVPPTTTTAKPEPVEQPKDEPKDEPPAPIVDRFTVEVPGKGSFVVEREGETLYVGNVTAAEGYTAEVHKEVGWKVYVGFSNGETVFFGKALINDYGEVEQHFWEEEIGPEPVYQWVEISGVGAAKFEVLENQIRVYKTETAEGFGAWDYNQGAYAGTAKVDFEGEGQIWFIEAWIDENGDLAWSTYQGG